MFVQPLGVEAIQAVLSGLAAGEALGLSSSFIGEPQPAPRPLKLGGNAAHGAVTEQVLLLAAVLADNCGFNPEDFAVKLARGADVENPVRMYSLATAEHIMLMRRGIPWAKARSVIASLEPPLDAVARAAAVPLFYTKERLVAEMAAAQLLVTSLDRRAAAAARGYALLLYYTIHGFSPHEAVEEAAEQTPRHSLRDALYAAADAAAEGAREATRILSRPGDPLARVLAAAAAPLLLAAKHGPEKALATAMQVAPHGAAHVAAAMAGALLAAAGYPPATAGLGAERLIAETARRLASANRGCRGLGAAEPAGRLTA